jgi:glycosyltransferase involved in cell wall biosynthesis
MPEAIVETEPIKVPRAGAAPKSRIGVDLLVLSQFTDTGMITYAEEILPRLFEAMPDCEWVLFLKEPSQFRLDLSKYPNVTIKKSRWMVSSWAWKIIGIIVDPFFERLDVLFIPVSRAPLIKTCKLIIFVHDVGFLTMPEYLKAGTVRKTRAAMRQSEQKADLLLTNSLFTRDEFCRWYKTPESKVKVTYLGVDEKLFNLRAVPDKVRDQILERYGVRRPYVLYLGVIQGRKNLVRLIEAQEIWHRQVGELQLVLAGKLGWNCNEIYEQAARFPEDVALTGRIRTEHLPILYGNAACYVLPSLYEGFGIPVIEAMACGVPTVLSNRSSLPEVGGDAAVYFNPEDPLAIAGAILKVVQSPDLRQKMITAGLDRAAEFTWTRIGENTVQAFRGVLADA